MLSVAFKGQGQLPDQSNAENHFLDLTSSFMKIF